MMVFFILYNNYIAIVWVFLMNYLHHAYKIQHLSQERRRLAINNARRQWEMMQGSMMSRSNRLVRPELVASHVANIPNHTVNGGTLGVPSIETIDTLDVSDIESLKSRFVYVVYMTISFHVLKSMYIMPRDNGRYI